MIYIYICISIFYVYMHVYTYMFEEKKKGLYNTHIRSIESLLIFECDLKQYFINQYRV